MAASDNVTPAASFTIYDLPPEIITHILARLDHGDYRACRAAARLWRVCSPSAYARRVLGAPYPPCPRDLGLAGDAMAIRGLLALGRLDVASCAWMPFTAAWHGHLDLLTVLHEADAPGFDRDVMDYAAGFGRLDMVTFLHHNRRERCTTYAMNRAAAQGHIEVVDFLHRHRREGCTRKAMDYAAASGHLNVVIYLDRGRAEGCTVGAINRAAANGHHGVVAYLLAHRKEGASAAAMTAAAANGDMDMLRLLARWNQPCDYRAMNAAAANGHVAVLEYLDTALGLGCTAEALVTAAAARHFDVVVFLLDRRLNDCLDGLSAASHEALAAGRVDLFQRMRDLMSSAGSPCGTPLRHTPPTVFRAIAAGGHIDAFEALCQHDPRGFVKNAPIMMAAAVAHGHCEIVNRLLSMANLADSLGATKAQHKTEDAVVDAAGRGHSDIIALLHRAGAVPFICIKEAAIAAAASGHLNALKVTESLCRSPMDHYGAVETTARGGHVNVLAHLVTLDSDIGYRPVCAIANAAMRGAASSGRDDVIKWLVTHYGDHLAPRDPCALGMALARGHLSTLRLLCGMAPDDTNTTQRDSVRIADTPPQHAWDDAARSGHQRAIAYLCRKGVLPHDANAMAREAVRSGHLAVIKFAYHALSSFDPQRALAEARALSRHDIALWLSDALSWGVPRPRATSNLFVADWSSLRNDDLVLICERRRPGKTMMMLEIMNAINERRATATTPLLALSFLGPDGHNQRRNDDADADGDDQGSSRLRDDGQPLLYDEMD
nr:Ankyrin repeat domain containing protein [Pandoravirus aubagnensis]